MVQTQNLFERIGGKAAVQTVVDEFYRRVLDDKLLAPMFADTDMDQQRRHQTAFLVAALGGPDAYKGKDMKAAHDGLGVSDAQFGAVAGHLQATLQWAGVGGEDVAAIMQTAASLRDQVVAG